MHHQDGLPFDDGVVSGMAMTMSSSPAVAAIPFGVNMNESGQIGAGLALETRYRTIARLNRPLGRPI
jgi:hypothetical protein